MADAQHYESRAIREGLKASIKRLSHTKGYIPAMLIATQSSVEQDFRSPTQNIDLEHDSAPGSSDPRFVEMRDTLLGFEASSSTQGQGAGGAGGGASKRAELPVGAKERAFFSALRTLLTDIVAARGDGDVAATRIAAAHSWFTRHRPRGLEQDPAALAALAATLSLVDSSGVGLGSGSGGSRGGNGKGGRSPGLAASGAFGTKHDFAAAYSKDGGRDTAAQALLVRAPPQRVAQPQAPLPRPAGSMSMVMQPSVSPQRRQPRATGDSAIEPMVPVPRGKLAFGSSSGNDGGQAAAGDWLPGPYHAGAVGEGRGGGGRTKGDARRAEEEELEGLRRRWADMDAASSSAGVDQQVQAWALQRARLEEEIIRRQEASRYAAPAMHAGSGSHLSPYAGMHASDQMGGEGGGGEVRGHLHGLGQLVSTQVVAREVREHAAEAHAAEVAEISRRAEAFGLLGGRVCADDVDHALCPVPEKAYLECLAKLPRAGDMLASRPGSELGSGVGKKKKGSSKVKKAKKASAK
ncbi:hypothetical protein FOA52_015590 [Chlamydomonas sp. UWO 241]|nr:hypothetical protein FOA52_015590 [Chlamydomonas sp. UWO 241]